MRKRANPVKRFEGALTRSYSLGRGYGYQHRVAFCSKCHRTVARWLQKQGCFQRYYCDECVKCTAAWKEQFGGKKKGAGDA